MTTYFNSTQNTEITSPRDVLIPSALLEANLLSETCYASDCFINQDFSNKLQAYLIGYVNSVYSKYAVPA